MFTMGVSVISLTPSDFDDLKPLQFRITKVLEHLEK